MSRVAQGTGNEFRDESGKVVVISKPGDDFNEEFNKDIEAITGQPSPFAQAPPVDEPPEKTEEEKKEEGEPKKEGEEEKKEEEKKEEGDFALPEELKSEFPDIKSEAEFVPALLSRLDELKAAKEELAEANESNDKFVAIMDRDPAIPKFLRDVHKGMRVIDAIQKNFKLGPDGVPDATKDPEAYKEFLRAQVEREQQQKEEVEEEKKAVARQEAIMEQALQLRSEFQKKKELSNDGMKRFLDWVNETLGGNPKNGKLPTDLYDRLYIAYTHEEDVKKAEEKGKKEGRTEVVEAKMREKKADGLPHLATKKEIAPTVSSEMKWLADMVKTQKRVPEGRPL